MENENTYGAVPHTPVLLRESMAFLELRPEGRYLDATVGAGGHAAAIAKRLRGGVLIGIDKDPEALELARKRLADFGDRVLLAHASFSQVDEVLDRFQINGLDGVLADLGISSMQIQNAKRGFSFHSPHPVDMRFNPTEGLKAAELLARWSFEDLERVLREYGEERYSRRVARRILRAREEGVALTGTALRSLIHQAIPANRRRRGAVDAATRSFMGIRMAVNQEPEELETFLTRIIKRCNPGAVIVIISFHSIEDRLVKRRFRSWERPCTCPKYLPLCVCDKKPLAKVLTRRVLRPGPEELAANPRARSAKLRAARVL